jgi:hypothetical protein
MPYPKEYLDLLAAINPGYTPDTLIDFQGLEDGTPAKNFTSFVYESVKNPGSVMAIESFELFLIKNPEINAFACRHDGLSLIAIHHSLFKAFEKRLRDRIPTASNNSTEIFNSVAKYLDVNIDFFMFQIMMLFVFYHEIAHLYQYKIADGNHHLAFERYSLAAANNFDQEVHAMEIDADMFAANNIAIHILQYWQGFAEEARNLPTLTTLIKIAMTAILLLFYELSQEQWHEIYFKEFDHPHELIRTAYIIEGIIGALSANFNEDGETPNYKDCIQNSLTIAEDLTREARIKKPGFVQVFVAYNKEINTYTDEMKDFLDKIPYLVMHYQKPETK